MQTNSAWNRIGVLLFVGLLAIGTTALAQATASLGNTQTTEIITMRDACDPTSFNLNVGPGTCVPGQHGNTLFSDFIDELTTDQNAGAWRFNPMLNAKAGTFKLVRLDLKSGRSNQPRE